MILFRAIEFVVSLASLKGTLMRMMPRVASRGRAGRWGSHPQHPRKRAFSCNVLVRCPCGGNGPTRSFEGLANP